VAVGDGMTNPMIQAPVYSSYAFAAGIISGGRRRKYQVCSLSLILAPGNGHLCGYIEGEV